MWYYYFLKILTSQYTVKQQCSFTVGQNINWYNLLRKEFGTVFQSIFKCSFFNPAIPLNIFLKWYEQICTRLSLYGYYFIFTSRGMVKYSVQTWKGHKNCVKWFKVVKERHRNQQTKNYMHESTLNRLKTSRGCKRQNIATERTQGSFWELC